MNSASSRRAAVSGQPPAVWGGRARRPGGVRARRSGGVRAPIAPRWHPAGMSQMAARYDLRARSYARCWACLLYTSDAADDLLCVDLGGRRIIKKKKKQ